MNPELIAWATLIFTQRAGTYEILSAEMLKAGYSRADIDAVYGELVTRAIAPPRAGPAAATAHTPPTPGAQPLPASVAPMTAPAAPVPEATVVSENVVPRDYHLGAIFTALFILVLIGGLSGTYFYAKGNPTSSLSTYINDTFVSLYLTPPFPAPAPLEETVVTPAPEPTPVVATTSAPIASSTAPAQVASSTATSTQK